MNLVTIRELRAKLHTLIILATVLTQKIHAAREQVKLVEDTIINEIWENPAYKNDRARNEQKHLARINDERYISAAQMVIRLEGDRAQCNADLLATQNELEVATLDYQANLMIDKLGMQFRLVPVVGVNPAEPNAISVKTELDVQAPTAPVEAAPVQQEEWLSPDMPDSKPADPNEAPYLKPGSDKKPETVGGVRI